VVNRNDESSNAFSNKLFLFDPEGDYTDNIIKFTVGAGADWSCYSTDLADDRFVVVWYN